VEGPLNEKVSGTLQIDAVLDPAAPRDAAVGLEEAGFARAWVTETVRDPYLCLASAAGASRRLELGTGVAIAFARSPMTTAQSAHDVQRLSGGRLWLGLGSQVRPHITRRFSMPWSHPARRMREYVLALRAIWASWDEGGDLRFEGEFYTHTLMTPYFNPGPTGYPPPPILLGGVGAKMIAMAGEVADGFLCGPLTSSLSFREYTLAALRRGRAAGPEAPATPFEVCAMPLVVTGPDAATTERVARATRRRIAFYASTPAYRHILELHGWEALHDRLYELSRRGAWDEMADLIDDQVLETFAVVAEPDSVAAALLDRFADDADRVIVHSALDPGHDVWRTVVAGAPQRARPAAR
jgi:probable F420-dependent oxidoreductase